MQTVHPCLILQRCVKLTCVFDYVRMAPEVAAVERTGGYDQKVIFCPLASN